MYRHLFLTGQKHIGKSTAIDRFISACSSETGSAVILAGELSREGYADAKRREKVAALMSGDRPVLGVLQENCPEWFDLLRADHRLLLITVTEENRDLVPGRIADWYQTEWLEPACKEVCDSYGAVVFDEDETGLYVLMIGSIKGWSFPKGHGRVGEDPSVAAAREIYEETGIRAEIDAGFRGVVPSILKGDDRTVTFFAGRSLDGRKIPIPMEVPGAQWVRAEEAADLIRFETDRQVYLDALAYRRSHSR